MKENRAQMMIDRPRCCNTYYSTGVASDLVADPWAVSGSRGPPVGGRHLAGRRRRKTLHRGTATTGACFLDRVFLRHQQLPRLAGRRDAGPRDDQDDDHNARPRWLDETGGHLSTRWRSTHWSRWICDLVVGLVVLAAVVSLSSLAWV
jgi:hypothetical protein